MRQADSCANADLLTNMLSVFLLLLGCLQWHAHTNAYRARLYGSTRWFMSPSNTMPSVPRGTSMLKWLDKYYRKLRFRPMECVQRAGEVAYVPAGWQHAVINLEAVVGMAYEVGDSCSPEWSTRDLISKWL